MSNHIYYSILQYKHSIVAGEVLNVGILFLFPKENEIKFVVGNLQRIKILYPEFETTLPIKINKNISRKISKIYSEANSLFSDRVIYSVNTEDSLRDYIKKYIFLEDSTALQFSEPFTAVDVFNDNNKTIQEYSKVLLPEVEDKKNINKHNESYIIRQFSDQLVKRNILIDHRFSRNTIIKTTGIDLTFDFSWQNGTTHLVKPISFDLKEERDIQKKSVEFYGYFNLLDDYAKLNRLTFDLLLWKPQDEKLYNSYQKAIAIIYKSKSPINIFTEDKLSEYTDYTAEELHKKDLL